MQQAQSAIEEMFSSPKLLAIQACSVHEQMFLNNWNLRRPLLPRCTPMYCSNSFNHTTNSSEYLVSTWISQISSDFGTRCRWAADQYLDDVRWCCRWKEMAFRSSPAPTNRSACRYYGLAEWASDSALSLRREEDASTAAAPDAAPRSQMDLYSLSCRAGLDGLISD